MHKKCQSNLLKYIFILLSIIVVTVNLEIFASVLKRKLAEEQTFSNGDMERLENCARIWQLTKFAWQSSLFIPGTTSRTTR